MMPSVTIYKDVEVEIEIDLEDFEDDELQDELKRRGLSEIADPVDVRDLIEKIWQLRRLKQPYDYLLDELIYDTIGKIV